MSIIKLRSLIVEDRYSDIETYVQTVAPVLKSKCPTSVAAYINPVGVKFYRGIRSFEAVIRHHPQLKFRKSKDSNNISLLFSGINPDWKDIPKRYNSVVFSNDEDVAAEYGTSVYDVFVEGTDPLIAVGTEKDNYENYRRGLKKAGGHTTSIENLDVRLAGLMRLIIPDGDVLDFTTMTSPNELKSALDMLDQELSELPEADLKEKLREGIGPYDAVVHNYLGIAMAIQRDGTEHYLRTIFDPETNGIQTIKLSNFSKVPVDLEAWTDQPVYLVRSKFRQELTRFLQ